MKSMFKKVKGFTLIELMIVIAIIAILAAILVPNFIRARAQGQLTACVSNAKNLSIALEEYAADNNGAYKNSAAANFTAALLGSTYVTVAPTCPNDGTLYTYEGAGLPTPVYEVYQNTGSANVHGAVLPSQSVVTAGVACTGKHAPCVTTSGLYTH